MNKTDILSAIIECNAHIMFYAGCPKEAEPLKNYSYVFLTNSLSF